MDISGFNNGPNLGESKFISLTLTAHDFGPCANKPGSDEIRWWAVDENGQEYSDTQLVGREDIDKWLLPALGKMWGFSNVATLGTHHPQKVDCTGAKFEVKAEQRGSYTNYKISFRKGKKQAAPADASYLMQADAKYAKYATPSTDDVPF